LFGVGYGNSISYMVDFYESGRYFGATSSEMSFGPGGSHNTLLTPFAEMGLLLGG